MPDERPDRTEIVDSFEHVRGVPPGPNVVVDFSNAIYASVPQDQRGRAHLQRVARVINTRDDPRFEGDEPVGQSYAVFTRVDDPSRIGYSTGPGHLPVTQEFNPLWARVMHLCSLRGATAGDDERAAYVRQIGDAVGSGLEGDHESMANGLDEAIDYLNRACRQNTRVPYVSSLMAAAMLAGGFGLYMLFAFTCGGASGCGCGTTCDEWNRVLATGLFGGAIGTLLFAAMKRDTPPYDPLSSVRFVVFEGVVRAIFGITGGLVASMAVISGVVSTALLEDPQSSAIFTTLVATAGGFIERYAPSLLRQVAPVEE